MTLFSAAKRAANPAISLSISSFGMWHNLSISPMCGVIITVLLHFFNKEISSAIIFSASASIISGHSAESITLYTIFRAVSSVPSPGPIIILDALSAAFLTTSTASLLSYPSTIASGISSFSTAVLLLCVTISTRPLPLLYEASAAR